MALDYLTIPGMSVNALKSTMAHPRHQAMSGDVEHVFSKGRLLLSHTHSCLSAQTTHCLLCLGSWSLIGLLKDSDPKATTMLPEVEGDDSDLEMESGWDEVVKNMLSK
jgi:hypothetical protein